MLLQKFKLFEPYEQVIIHGFSGREGGVSSGPFSSLNLGLDVGDSPENIEENYRRFCASADVLFDRIHVAIQDHSDRVLVVDSESKGGIEKPFTEIDGFITAATGVPILVRFADCQGALIFDPVKKIVAAVHSGWRGNAQNILGKTISRLVKKFDSNPSDILVGISPSLGPCCAEFSDPMVELPEEMHPFVSGRHVDLWDCSLQQLLAAGVVADNIEMARKCTVCENDKYFSFRGGKRKTGHMGAVIMLK